MECRSGYIWSAEKARCRSRRPEQVLRSSGYEPSQIDQRGLIPGWPTVIFCLNGPHGSGTLSAGHGLWDELRARLSRRRAGSPSDVKNIMAQRRPDGRALAVDRAVENRVSGDQCHGRGGGRPSRQMGRFFPATRRSARPVCVLRPATWRTRATGLYSRQPRIGRSAAGPVRFQPCANWCNSGKPTRRPAARMPAAVRTAGVALLARAEQRITGRFRRGRGGRHGQGP